MTRLAHIVNPVIVDERSDLFIAQPITFASMRDARAYASDRVEVELYSAQYPEDRAAVPHEFHLTPDLERSVLDVGTFAKPRKLPLIRDILQRLYDSSTADYFVYTNVDIALMPYFYVAIDALLQKGYDSLSINRRTISPKHPTVPNLTLLYAAPGEPHGGSDCFVFRRDALPTYELGTVCIGTLWLCTAVLLNLAYQGNKFRVLRDRGLTFHIGNDMVWTSPEFNDYEAHNWEQLAGIIRNLERDNGSLLSRDSLVRDLRRSWPGRTLLGRMGWKKPD
jgi:hypothetical protein